jgi:hypothetical protein
MKLEPAEEVQVLEWVRILADSPVLFWAATARGNAASRINEIIHNLGLGQTSPRALLKQAVIPDSG